MEYACHVWGGSTHTDLLDKVESKVFRSSVLLQLLAVFVSNLATMFLPIQFSIAIFVLTALLNLLSACLLFPNGLAVHVFRHKLNPNTIQTPYARVNHYRDSLFPSTSKIGNTFPASVFPPVYDLSTFKRGVSRHFCNLY